MVEKFRKFTKHHMRVYRRIILLMVFEMKHFITYFRWIEIFHLLFNFQSETEDKSFWKTFHLISIQFISLSLQMSSNFISKAIILHRKIEWISPAILRNDKTFREMRKKLHSITCISLKKITFGFTVEHKKIPNTKLHLHCEQNNFSTPSRRNWIIST